MKLLEYPYPWTGLDNWHGPVTLLQETRGRLHPWYRGDRRGFCHMAGNWFWYRKHPIRFALLELRAGPLEKNDLALIAADALNVSHVR
jgi:hypothetical protein